MRVGTLKEVDGKVVSYENLKGFDLRLDADGAIGIFGAAKFDSFEQLELKIKEIGDLLRDAYRFQVEHGKAKA